MIREKAANDSQSMGFFVRQYRNIFPTNQDWLNMTQEDIVKEYWQIHFWELRKAGAAPGDETTEYEASTSFEQEMEDMGLTNIGGKWVEIDPSEIEE